MAYKKSKKSSAFKMVSVVLVMAAIVAVIVYIAYNKPAAAEGFVGGDGDYHMVMFKADWCGYCKKALPTYSELMKNMQGSVVDADRHLYFDIIDPELDSNKVILTPVVTGGENTTQVILNTPYGQGKPVQITGFPTYVMYAPGGAEPVRYQGLLDHDAIMTFVKAL